MYRTATPMAPRTAMPPIVAPAITPVLLEPPPPPLLLFALLAVAVSDAIDVVGDGVGEDVEAGVDTGVVVTGVCGTAHG